MKPGAVLLNFARDAIVDEAAVVEALRADKLKAYLTDFPSPALSGVRGVIALPHLGASTAEAEENCAVMVVDQLREYLEHGGISNAVNFPQVEMARESRVSRRHRQRQRAQHARPDLDRDGQRRAEHPQHGEQVARRDGVHDGRRRQPGRAKRDRRDRGDQRRAVGAVDSGRA